MRRTVFLMPFVIFVGAGPAWAGPCAVHIQTVERRLKTTGASKITGDKPDPNAESGSRKAVHETPPVANPEQKPSGEKISQARAFIAKAKRQEQAGDERDCENSMEDAVKLIGALP